MFLKPDKQNKTDRKKLESSSHLVLFTTKNNTPPANGSTWEEPWSASC